jgi:DNA-binding response OmpR family regulator
LADILVVDDDSWVLDSITVFLQHVGYEVTTACSGEEGINLIDSGYEYDLVITDIRMPGISGNELAKQLRESNLSPIPVVAITGFHDEVDEELFDRILQKPFKFDILLETVKMLLNPNRVRAHNE